MSVVANPVEIGGLISRTPGIKRGTPHIAGSGVTVRTIVRYYKLGMSPEEIAAGYPHLSLAQVIRRPSSVVCHPSSVIRRLSSVVCHPSSVIRPPFSAFQYVSICPFEFQLLTW
jgi:uncharacterized protein (DUF433 family)